MNISRTFIAACAAVAFGAAAHASYVPVGFCKGKLAETGVSKVGNATVSCAVVLSEDMLRPYAGATLSGVRVGLVTGEGVGAPSVWVRHSLDGGNLDEAPFDPTAGWNMAPLSGGLVVDGQPLAVGFSFDQEKSVKCISITGENVPDGKWIAKGDKWEEAKQKGSLSIELVLSSPDFPEKDILLSGLHAAVMPVKSGTDMALTVSVEGRTLEDVAGYQIDCLVDGETVGTFGSDEVIAYGSPLTIELTLPTGSFASDQVHTLGVLLSSDDDMEGSNNYLEMPVGTYTECFGRTVLVEEFTTENCSNCPRAINTLKQCEAAGYGDRMAVVAHHVGYGTDWLTVEDDAEYLWFFGEEGSFAPSVMLDRTVENGKEWPTRSIGYFNDFEPTLVEAIDVPAFVDVNVGSEITDGILSVSVDAERLPLLDVLAEDQLLTVYVTEDEIPHHFQAGISSTSFTHSHVMLRCLSEVWGSPVAWSDDKAQMEFSCDIPEEWNADNLNVVAFVHEHDFDDPAACRVFNCAISKAGVSGVDAIRDARVTDTEYYGIDGRRLSDRPDGICIVRARAADGSVSVKKYLR